MVANEFLSQFEWVALPASVRSKLRQIFKIQKSGSVRVVTFGGVDRVASDGTEPEDLMNALNIKSALEYLEEKFDEKKVYDFSQLFSLVLTKAGFPPVHSTAIVDPSAAKGADHDHIPPAEKVKKQVKEGAKKIKVTQKKKEE